MALAYFNPRSPHGERRLPLRTVRQPARFQSTLPARGATRRFGSCRRRYRISIHAPRTGSDQEATQTVTEAAISIHAPRTGSDNAGTQEAIRQQNFNPRSPHGERRYNKGYGACSVRFQSTLPARGATALTAERIRGVAISIHAPRTGSDLVLVDMVLYLLNFNPRSPHGERQQLFPKWKQLKQAFQSTLPARGATRHHPRPGRRQGISIHAPRTGSDLFRVV